MTSPSLAFIDDASRMPAPGARFVRPLDGCAEPSALAFDPRARALHVADGLGGAVIRVDGARQRRVATVEPGGVLAGDRVGGLAVGPHGALFATRVGHGRAGAVVRIEPDGAVEALAKPAPVFWRMGLAYDASEHALYTTQFRCSPRGAFDGSIVVIELAGGEPSTVLDGFDKPVGIAKLGAALVVADARQRAVYRVDLVAGRAVQRLQLSGDLGRPDAVCACGADSVLVTTFDDDTGTGAVRRLWLDGRARVVASGPWEARGVACDGALAYVAARRPGRVIAFAL